MINVSDLPCELLRRILDYSTLPELVVLSEVCTLWRLISFDVIGRRTHLYMCPAVQRLIHHGSNDYRIFKSVTNLTIDIGSEHSSVLCDLCKLFPHLPSLDSVHVNISVSAEYVSELRGMEVVHCFTHLTTPLVSLHCEFRANETFGLGQQSKCSWLAQAIFTQILSTSSQSLKCLIYKDLRLYFGEGNILQALGAFCNLEILDLSGCRVLRYTNELVVSCAQLTHLKHLDIRRTRVPVNDEFVTSISQHCPSLEFCGLSNVIHVSVQRMRNFLTYETSLKSIQGYRCDVEVSNLEVIILLLDNGVRFNSLAVYHLSIEQMLMLARSQINEILTLKFTDSHNLTDMVLHEFARKPRVLRELKVLRCLEVTSRGLGKVIRALPSLELVDVEGSRYIDDSLLEQLSGEKREKDLQINVHDTAIYDVRKCEKHNCLFTGCMRNICVTWTK